MKKEFHFTVRGYHCDAYGHINNARYFELCEEARWQIVHKFMGTATFREKKLQFFIVNIDAQFKAPALPGDDICIETSLCKIGNTSCSFLQEMIKEEKVIFSAQITFVLFSVRHKLPARIDENLTQILRSAF